MIHGVFRYFLGAFLLSFLAGCGSSASSVPFFSRIDTLNGSLPSLKALSPAARDGVLRPSRNEAVFGFGLPAGSESHSSVLAENVAIEVDVSLAGESTVLLSLLYQPAESSVPESSVPVSESSARNLGGAVIEYGRQSFREGGVSILRNATGSVRLRLQVETGAFPAGVRLVCHPSAENLDATAFATVHALSMEDSVTGWQKHTGFLWTGADFSGLDIDARDNFNTRPHILSADSVIELLFSAHEDIGTLSRQGQSLFSGPSRRFSVRHTPLPYRAYIPVFMIGAGQVIPVSPADGLASFRVHPTTAVLSAHTNMPLSPILSDPHLMLEWPLSRWRRADREVFSWDRFPSILIFDTADYRVQDRYFKRLAFFVEKTGFTGRLWHDADIAHLHAFNAHDYRSESLASFFETARVEHFPLNREERELEDILLAQGIIRKDGQRYVPGIGAVLSISRESTGYLRYLFMAHEGYHGLYFIDEDFRQAVKRVYNTMHPDAIAFLAGYFSIIESLAYDITDEYLMQNEFMAYILQQPSERVGEYFSKNLRERFVRYGGEARLSEYIAESGAAEFVRAARELNDYVFTRWGISGGRIGLVSIHSTTR